MSHNSRGVWTNMEARGRESGRRYPPDLLLLVPRLLPFLASCALYFLLWLPLAQPSGTSALVKCLPVLCLALFVHTTAPSGPYGRFIWAGLLCSALGDVFLIWPSQFLLAEDPEAQRGDTQFVGFGLSSVQANPVAVAFPVRIPRLFFAGMAAFALAHLFYLGALGWVLVRPVLLGPVAAVFGLYLGLLQLHLPSALRLPVAAYVAVLALMLWRALARGRCAALGGLFFSISDAVLAWDTFVGPLPPGRAIVMVTYYAAQALLALSAVEGRAPKAD